MLGRALKRLPRGTLVLVAVAFANVLLGLVRESTVAYFFGVSAGLDAFLVGLVLPRLMVVNVVQISVAVVLPIYVGYRQAGRIHDATALLQRWFLASGAAIMVVCAVLFIAAEPVAGMIAPGFSEEQQLRSAQWLRMLLPYAWLMACAGTFKIVLDTHRRFFAPAMAQGLVSFAVIVSCGFAASSIGLAALAVGFVAGGLAGFCVQLLSARRFEPRVPSLKIDRKLSLPIAAGVAMALQSVASQLNELVDRAFASNLPEGSVAAYSYAQALNTVPSTVVTAALATALFPVLAHLAAGGNLREAASTTKRWILVVILVGTPVVALIVLLRVHLVALAFERGSFNADATALTSSVLVVLPWAIVVTGSSALLVRLLLVQGRHKTIAALAFAGVGAKLVLSWLLVSRWGLVGLATATVGAGVIATVLRFVFAMKYREGSAGETA